jgi:secreted trypsin-like serine protease
MRARLAVLATSVALLACDGPATGPVQRVDARGAVTHGELDGAGHPAVVLIIMDVGGKPAFRCSGTLIAPKVVLTAGHCAGEPGEFSGLRVFTESDVENGNNNYPFSGPNTIEAAEWRAHPQYTNAAFFLHDVGVVVLSKAVKLAGNQYGKLPKQDALDALQPRSSTLFTAVGYGLQRVNPALVEDELIRMRAEPHLVQINTGFTGDFSILLSNNASTGGTCFGDSGGPNYLGSSNVVAGVTSFGLNGSCGGTGGVFRVDRKNVLDFVNQFLR